MKSLLTLVRRIALALVLALGVVAACEEPDFYVYSAQHFDPDRECLEPYKPVEVVTGTGANLCRARCFTVNRELYVSTLCPPLPAIATAVLPDAAECIHALSLADAACSDEAPEPEEEDDASGDTGKPPLKPIDAGVDAPPDAAADG